MGPNLGGGIETPLPMLSDKIETGYQSVILVGNISYNDGFPDSEVDVPFCYQTLYYERTKSVTWGPCEISEILPRLTLVDRYPNNEYQPSSIQK